LLKVVMNYQSKGPLRAPSIAWVQLCLYLVMGGTAASHRREPVACRST